MNGVEINTLAYVATRLLLRWDYLYAVTLKTKVFGDYNHARLEVSWITSKRGLLLRGYTGRLVDRAPLISFARKFTNMHVPAARSCSHVAGLGVALYEVRYIWASFLIFEHNTFSSLCIPVSSSFSPSLFILGLFR